jgi:hypothetical protein
VAELAWPGNTGTPTDYLLEIVSEGGRAIDLGGGHFARFFHESYVLETPGEHGPSGFFHVHPAAGKNHTPAGDPCAGSVTFDLPEVTRKGPKWTLHSLDPLHVEPSILCSCGRHGFVRAGRWEEA